MPLDITEMNAPKSDQLDAVDLTHEGRVFTIAGVNRNSSPDQPLNVQLAEFPRVWRPAKSMRRVMAAIWGQDAEQYVGRSLHLFTDPDVEFGGQRVGGVRIRAMSHMDKPRQVPLLIKKGRSGMFTVKPLADAPAPVQQQPAPARGDITDARVAMLGSSGKRVLGGTPETRMAWLSQFAGRPITHPNQLSDDEGKRAIDRLDEIESETPPQDAA